MFRTEIEPLNYDFKLDHSKRLIAIGSCFSHTIGQRLEQAKFSININPYGTVFNPLSIFNLLDHAIEQSPLDETSIIQRDGLYLSHELHSSFKAASPEKLQQVFQKKNARLHKNLKKAEVLIITLGTSWIYEKKRSQELVSNCHKVPQKEFDKRLLHLEEIMTGFFTLKEKLDELNPKLRILLTVSPVRHTRDTLHGNAVSKSNLLLACHYLSQMADNVYYFPSYEMVVDDLRDYRFFEKDMIHPNAQAIEYIWEKFSSALFTEKAIKDCEQLTQIQSAIAHEAFNPKSEAHQQFLSRTLMKAEELNKEIGLKKEIKKLKSRLAHDWP